MMIFITRKNKFRDTEYFHLLKLEFFITGAFVVRKGPCGNEKKMKYINIIGYRNLRVHAMSETMLI